MILRRIRRCNAVQVTQEFHTSPENQAQKYVERQASMLKKMMTGSKASKKKFFTVDQTPAKQFQDLAFLDVKGAAGRKSVSGRVLKRVKVLNVLFVEQITSLLSTGEVGADLISHGFEITQVKVVPDFSHVLIYWQPSGTESDDVLESKLSKVAGHLRHELSGLRVIGVVPPIKFVKDPYQARVSEVEALLSKCDFGPDYEPVGVSRLKSAPPPPVGLKYLPSRFSEHQPTFKDLEEEKKQDESNKSGTEDDESQILNASLEEILEGPKMRQDILGLDREAIMTKITNSLQKRSTKETPITAPGYSFEPNSQTFDEEEDIERRKDFLKYLEQQRRAKVRELKRTSTRAKEREFLNSERLERARRLTDAHDELHPDSPYEGDDYIHDHEDASNSQHRF